MPKKHYPETHTEGSMMLEQLPRNSIVTQYNSSSQKMELVRVKNVEEFLRMPILENAAVRIERRDVPRSLDVIARAINKAGAPVLDVGGPTFRPMEGIDFTKVNVPVYTLNNLPGLEVDRYFRKAVQTTLAKTSEMRRVFGKVDVIADGSNMDAIKDRSLSAVTISLPPERDFLPSAIHHADKKIKQGGIIALYGVTDQMLNLVPRSYKRLLWSVLHMSNGDKLNNVVFQKTR